MKSIISAWVFRGLVLSAALTLTACGGSSSSDGTTPTTNNAETTTSVTNNTDTTTTTPNNSGSNSNPTADQTVYWNAPYGVKGSVRNVLNTESLAGVAVEIYDSADFERGGELPIAASFTMQPLRSVLTDEEGQFSTGAFKVIGYPVFRYFLAGYVDTTLHYTAPAPDFNDQSALQLEPARLPTPDEVIGTPDIAGKIKDAITGMPVENATVKLFRDGNTGLAANYTLETDSDGIYEQEAVEAGVYSAVISATGYVTTSRNTLYAYVGATSDYDEQNLNLNFTIAPVSTEGVWRIVLTWGEHPEDLDSHMWAPSEGLTAENCTVSGGWDADKHIAYYNEEDANNTLNLDIDEVDGYGPETITIAQQQTGTYYYSIHHYSGEKIIAESGAKIQVYKGSELKKEFYAPTTGGEGKYVWEVFNLNGDTITTVNAYQTHSTGSGGLACPRSYDDLPEDDNDGPNLSM